MEDKMFYEVSNKQKLCGILNKVNDKKEIVVICHAKTSNKDSNSTTKISEELTNNGINNFRFDFISCGESSGKYQDYTVTNMINNLNDTLKMLKDDYRYCEFILIGCSMGARIISLVDRTKFNIRKIILWYGALDYYKRIFNLPSKKERIAKKNGYYLDEKGIKFSYEYFVDKRRYTVYKELIKWDVPKLFIHGTKDSHVNYKSSVKVSKKCNNSKLILIIDGGHGFSNDKHLRKALNSTIDFIKEDYV